MTHDTEQPFRLDQMARPRRRTGMIAGLIAGGAVFLVGATVAVTLAATHDTAPPGSAPQTTAAGSGTTAAAAAPPPATTTAAAQAPVVLKLGAKAEGPNSTSTVYSYKQPVAVKAPKPEQDGWEWGAADVEVCAKGSGFLNNLSWVLVYADHTRIEASGDIYQQFPQPQYPVGDTDIVAGQCIRGWITYAVPAGKRPATVHYQPRGFQADWAVA